MTDLEIATKADIKSIRDIARRLNIDLELLEQYGKYKAKLPLSLIDQNKVDA
ncbi:MAG: formate--tetrahydrofolate ligase, partial [Bacteroidia bacterium]|nr:formate--tetrahydrofolate ligase [Bacteroidia bacterium]